MPPARLLLLVVVLLALALPGSAGAAQKFATVEKPCASVMFSMLKRLKNSASTVIDWFSLSSIRFCTRMSTL